MDAREALNAAMITEQEEEEAVARAPHFWTDEELIQALERADREADGGHWATLPLEVLQAVGCRLAALSSNHISTAASKGRLQAERRLVRVQLALSAALEVLRPLGDLSTHSLAERHRITLDTLGDTPDKAHLLTLLWDALATRES